MEKNILAKVVEFIKKHGIDINVLTNTEKAVIIISDQ